MSRPKNVRRNAAVPTCADCPKRPICRTLCPRLRRYLSRAFRAYRSPAAQHWGAFCDLERHVRRRPGAIRKRW
jgi:hypothetical protein